MVFSVFRDTNWNEDIFNIKTTFEMIFSAFCKINSFLALLWGSFICLVMLCGGEGVGGGG